METLLPFALLLAFILDLIIGDPEWLPHPVRWIGRGIFWGERVLRRNSSPSTPGAERFLGAVLALAIVSATYALSALSLYASFLFSKPLFFALSVYIIWSGLAIKSLRDEVEGVLSALASGLPASRKRLKRIVGRDTENLSREGVLRACAETCAENTSDGIIAPLFHMILGVAVLSLIGRALDMPSHLVYILGGPPFVLAYKAVNTLDSMVGYRNERYLHFGRFSARLDDLANYIPARMTAIFMVFSSFLLRYDWRGSLAVVLRDGRKHPSPNAGLPEAAAAGALGVRFGGRMAYGGVPSEKPFIGVALREVDEGCVRSSIRITYLSAFFMVLLTFALELLLL